jgi:hypothetical protein
LDPRNVTFSAPRRNRPTPPLFAAVPPPDHCTDLDVRGVVGCGKDSSTTCRRPRVDMLSRRRAVEATVSILKMSLFWPAFFTYISIGISTISRKRFFLRPVLISRRILTKQTPPCASHKDAFDHVQHDPMAPPPPTLAAVKGAKFTPLKRPWGRGEAGFWVVLHMVKSVFVRRTRQCLFRQNPLRNENRAKEKPFSRNSQNPH